MANACGIQDPASEPSGSGRRAFGYSGWLAGQRSVLSGGASKRGAGKATSKGGTGEFRRSIRCRRGWPAESFAFHRLHRLACLNWFSGTGRSKSGACAVQMGRASAPTDSAKIPYPLGKDLGKPPFRMEHESTIGQIPARCLHRPAPSQTSHECPVEVKHIRGSKRRIGKRADKQLVRAAPSCSTAMGEGEAVTA